MQKNSVQNQSVRPIEKQQLLFAFYYLIRAGGFHFHEILNIKNFRGYGIITKKLIGTLEQG